VTAVAAEPEMLISAITPWFGSKRAMAPRIARECCREDGRAPSSFWELCCGSMAVTIAMPRCAHHHAVDLHGDLMNLARIIQCPRRGPVFYRKLRRILNHETLYGEAQAAIEADDLLKCIGVGLFSGASAGVPLDELDRAILFFVASWQGRNGVAGTERTNFQAAVRWTAGGGHSAIRFANAVRSIPAWRIRLRDVSMIQRDIFEVLEKIEDADGTTIYIDPPYLRDGESRSGSCTYLHEFKSRHHVDLANALRRFESARVVVSYYDNDYVRELYERWTIVDCATQKNLHVQNRRGVGRCNAPEILLINGPSYTTQTPLTPERSTV
jgi:DNA adenine methylase